MPDTFMPLSEVEWVEQLVCDRYNVTIPKFLAEAHEWWPTWEKERFASMEQNLKQGDILFDVGSETGWQAAIYAQFVGAGNMCLFEPCAQVWPNIKATWERNGLPTPMCSSRMLLSNKNPEHPPAIVHRQSWPDEAGTDALLVNTKYNHIDEDGDRVPQATIDRFVEISAIKPTAITIDVEGAELLVLQGAEKTLREIRPLVWVSLHEGFVSRPGVNPVDAEVVTFMNFFGYQGEVLGVDHETQTLWRPK